MSHFTRRTILAGAVLGAGAPAAFAQTPQRMRPAESMWSPPPAGSALPLDAHITTGSAQLTLRQWLGGRPAALALWASWCGPCLREKRRQALMARRLAEHGAATRILVLQTFDDVSLAEGRDVLARLNAASLINARAMPDAEAAFIRHLGASPADPRRTSMPWVMLVDSSGRELGRALGVMTAADGVTDYWEDDASFEYLARLT